jgi:hypothetical protein
VSPLVAAGLALALAAGDAPEASPGAAAGPGVIQDNSFLVEEAYNQEPGVVQHISMLQRDRDTGEWLFTFTEEWPAHGQEHQVSATLQLARVDAGDGQRSGLGDVALNYRWQAVGDGAAPVAVAPRVSALIPTGDWREGRGAGGPGLQVALPVSATLGSHLVGHFNLGATWVPWGRTTDGDARSVVLNLGQGLVWLVHQSVNLMFEATYTVAEVRTDSGPTTVAQSLLLSPGIRGAVDTSFGLQIVPGLALPFGFGPSAGRRQVLLYLSFEHPVTRHPW